MKSVHIVLSLFLITSIQFVCPTSAAKKKDDGCDEVGCFPPKSTIPRGKHIACFQFVFFTCQITDCFTNTFITELEPSLTGLCSIIFVHIVELDKI